MSDYPKLSARKVWLPRATSIGYARPYVKRGELVSFVTATMVEGNDHYAFGRVLGTVAEYWQPGDTNLKGYVCLLALSDSGTHAHVRYVRPDQIREAHDASRLDLLRYFASAQLGNPDDVRRYADYGSMSSSFIAQHMDASGALRPFGEDGRPAHVVAQDSK